MGNRTRDVPACSAVPQPHAIFVLISIYISLLRNVHKQIFLFDSSWIIKPLEHKRCVIDKRTPCTQHIGDVITQCQPTDVQLVRNIYLLHGRCTISSFILTVTGAVKPGSLVALMGGSGAGKSTLMAALAYRNPGKKSQWSDLPHVVHVCSAYSVCCSQLAWLSTGTSESTANLLEITCTACRGSCTRKTCSSAASLSKNTSTSW
jgi:hypothetical protein